MIQAQLLSKSSLSLERHIFILTDAASLRPIIGKFDVSDLLRLQEVGFYGPHCEALHDQFDELIGDGQKGDPLTQTFSDANQLREYLKEHVDVGVDCFLWCDGVKYLSFGKSISDELTQ